MNNKKKKLFVRILCGLLVVIMTLGLIVPYVFASEIEDEVAILSGVVDENNEEDISSDQEESYDVISTPWQPEGAPEELPPAGYLNVRRPDGTWGIQKMKASDESAFVISGLPENYDCNSVTLFIANLETQVVLTLNLEKEDRYVNKILLADGYYVIFSNNFSFCNTNGVGYSIRGGENLYFYVGDVNEFDAEKYPVDFLKVKDDYELFELTLLKAPADFEKVSATTVLTINSEEIPFPDDVKVEALGMTITSDPIVDEENNNTQTEPSEKPVEKPNENNKDDEQNKYAWYKLLFNGLKKNIFLIVALVACYIGTVVIKIKKKNELIKQAENDKYDEGLIE